MLRRNKKIEKYPALFTWRNVHSFKHQSEIGISNQQQRAIHRRKISFTLIGVVEPISLNSEEMRNENGSAAVADVRAVVIHVETQPADL
jgi:hypothetical protein